MAKISLDGVPCNTKGELPVIGDRANDFIVTGTNLQDLKLSEFLGKKVLLNIFPSIKTGVCAAAARQFNRKVGAKKNIVVLCISKDLPFTHHEFCEAEGIENIIMTSQYKNTSFSDAYPVEITSGAFTGLFSRAVIIIDEDGIITYTEQVPDIGQEPDYERAIKALEG